MDEPVRLGRGAKDLAFDGDSVTVTLPGGRVQRIAFDASDPRAYRLVSTAGRPRDLEHLCSPELWAWRRNRTAALVAFRIDGRGRLLVEAWMPRAGLTPGEFLETVRTLAAEADRVEYLLTGEDVE